MNDFTDKLERLNSLRDSEARMTVAVLLSDDGTVDEAMKHAHRYAELNREALELTRRELS